MGLPVLFSKGEPVDSPASDQAVTDTPPSSVDDTVVEGVTKTGMVSRLIAFVAVFGVLLAGTLYGLDDHFPFGPFRMYSVAKKANETIPSTRVEGVNAAGERVQVKGGHSGLRRAEIEGQLRRFQRHPELLDDAAAAYAKRNPNKPPLVRIEIISRNFILRDGKPTGEKIDEVVLSRDVAKATK